MTAIFAVFLAFLSSVLAQEANILIRKNLDSEIPGLFAPGRNFTVQIELWNVGDSPAYDVRVTDAWPLDKFNLTGGNTNQTFPEIAPGTKESYNFTLQPGVDSEYHGFAARVEYQQVKDGPIQIGWSTLTRPIQLIENEIYHKLTAKHYVEWFLFLALALGSVVVPFLYWLHLITNYEHGIPKLEKKSKKKSVLNKRAWMTFIRISGEFQLE